MIQGLSIPASGLADLSSKEPTEKGMNKYYNPIGS